MIKNRRIFVGIICLIALSSSAESIRSRTFSGGTFNDEDSQRLQSLETEVRSLNLRIEKLDKIVTELSKKTDYTNNQHSPEDSGSNLVNQEIQIPEKHVANQTNGSEKQEYDIALSSLKSGDLVSSQKKFEFFIANFPRSPLVSNAYFWCGEAEIRRKHYDKAAVQYLKSYKHSPKGPKSLDALVKLASCLHELKKNKEACGILNKLDTEFKVKNPGMVDKIKNLRSKVNCK